MHRNPDAKFLQPFLDSIQKTPNLTFENFLNNIVEFFKSTSEPASPKSPIAIKVTESELEAKKKLKDFTKNLCMSECFTYAFTEELYQKNFELEAKVNHLEMKNHLLEETLTKRNIKFKIMESENTGLKERIDKLIQEINKLANEVGRLFTLERRT
jgi:hypothetical protein